MIPVSKPWLTDRERKYVNEAMSTGWISSNGTFIIRFEEAFAAYLGVKHAISTNNGTSACHVCLDACGVRAGHRVAVPAMTFVATANAVRYCGAEVVGIDIDPLTWNMSSERLAEAYRDKPFDFVFQVHLYGNVQPPTVTQGCGPVILVEDACEALGGEWGGKKAGTMGKAGAFSFFGNKTISTGEGGMVVTNDDAIAERARLLKGQGQTSRYYHEIVGYNYRMTNVQAAIGLAQIERIDEIMSEKKRVYEFYERRLGQRMAKQIDGSKHSFWAITVDVGNPEHISSVLAENGIESRRTFYSLCDLPPYKESCFGGCPVAQLVRASSITLPSYPELQNDDIRKICDIVESEGKAFDDIGNRR